MEELDLNAVLTFRPHKQKGMARVEKERWKEEMEKKEEKEEKGRGGCLSERDQVCL